MAKEAQHEALYRKWRPQTFSAIIGQEHVSKTLANAVSSDRVAHAYLFCGPRGTGKTSTARILAKALNCEKGPTPEPCGVCLPCVEVAEGSSLDVIEVDAASYRQVEETQEVLKGVHLAPSGAPRKIYIIDEVHMLSNHSFNALLKTLEEPPDHVVFVLATTEPHRVLPTVLSRCQRFDFRRVPAGILAQHLEKIAEVEKIKISEEALALIARRAQGGVRDALGALEQIAGFCGDQRIGVREATRLLGAVELDLLIQLVDDVNAGRIAEAFGLVRSLTESGREARSFIAEIIEYLRQLFLVQQTGEEDVSDFFGQDLEKVVSQAERIQPSRMVALMEAFGDAYERSRGSDARLILEMTVVKLARPEADASLEGILRRLDRLEAAMAGGAPVARIEPCNEEKSTPSTKQEKSPASKLQDKESPAVPRPQAVRESPSPPPQQAGKELDRITAAWDAILDSLRKSKPAARACLIESKPAGFAGGRLALRFSSQANFHRDRVEGEYSVNVVEAIKMVTGFSVVLDCQLEGEPGGESPAGESGGLSIDEVVGLVSREFDAKIIHGSSAYTEEAPVLEEE